MSTTSQHPPLPRDRQPYEEMANRAATAGAGLAAAAEAVGLQDHMRMLKQHAIRLRDAHRLHLQSLGIETPAPGGDMSDDEMGGDVHVQGDTTNYQVTPQQTSTAPAPPSSGPNWLQAAAAAVLGAGALALIQWAATPKQPTPGQPPPPAVDTDTRNAYILDLSTGDQPKQKP